MDDVVSYNSTHTGAQIDAAVKFGMAPDSTPIAGSTKGVTSGGVKAALDQKQDSIIIDSQPVQGSENPVASGGMYSVLQLKAPLNSPQFTGTPTAQTPTRTDNSNRLATTAFVQGLVSDIDQNIADEFDAAVGYSVGDMVIRNGYLYIFIGDNRMLYRTSDNNLYRTSDSKVYRVNQSQWGAGSVRQIALADVVTQLLNRVPAAPTVNGTYTLKVTVSGGVETYSWAS